MKRFIIFSVSFFLILAAGLTAGGGKTDGPGGGVYDNTPAADETPPPEDFVVTYENPMLRAGDTILCGSDFNQPNLPFPSLNSGGPKGSAEPGKTIYVTRDSLERMGTTPARLVMENPGSFIIMPVVPGSREFDETIRETDEFVEANRNELDRQWNDWHKRTSAARQEALTAEFFRSVSEEVAEGRGNVPTWMKVTCGSSSLDRNFTITFIYINPPDPEYRWTQERLDYTMLQTERAVTKALELADMKGIKLRAGFAHVLVDVPYNPLDEAAGVFYSGSWDVDGLDEWRSAAVGALGYAPNFHGLLNFNLYWKERTGYPEGAVGFVLNCNDRTTHITGFPVDWAHTWNENLHVCKPIFTVGFSTVDSIVLYGKTLHEMLHVFGAVDEYKDGANCTSTIDCSSGGFGELGVINGNCWYCANPQHSCIMQGGDNGFPLGICPYTAAHVGWRDSEGQGGSDVDDFLDHTGFVTGWYDIGDVIEIREISDNDFVNAFVVSYYNSYEQPDGRRTVWIPGMNYTRQKISPGLYYANHIGGDLNTCAINLNNNHPPLEVEILQWDGAWLVVEVTGVGHTDMVITHPITGEMYYPFFGSEMLAGDHTIYGFFFKGDWGNSPDGTYSHWSRSWCGDGVYGFTTGGHILDYGPPSPAWTLDSIYLNDSGNVDAFWSPQSYTWTWDACMYINSEDFTGSLRGTCGWVSSIGNWPYDAWGSDSCAAMLKQINANGVTSSNEMSFVTLPHIPIYIVVAAVCGTTYVETYSMVWVKYPYGHWDSVLVYEPQPVSINAIAVSCVSPMDQRLEQLDYYLFRYGTYVHVGDHYEYQWDTLFLYADWTGGPECDTIRDLQPNSTYTWNIRTVDKRDMYSEWAFDNYQTLDVGAEAPSDAAGVTKTITNIPKMFALNQNYPNPFNAVTQIIYGLPQASHVKIEIRNIMGQKVATLIDKVEEAGVHRVQWNATSKLGEEVASGIYFYRLEAESFVQTRKMTLLK
jgi:hypothetical protein